MQSNSDPSFLTRRHFLKLGGASALAAGSLPLILSSASGRAAGASAVSNQIALGVIGCGPQGMGVMGNFLNQKDCRVVAVCDVKQDQLGAAQGMVNKHYGNSDCRTYRDFRELVARKDIDACLIATPDHWHVLTALAAVNSGKDIYLEKPLAVTLEERQALRKAVRKNKRIFQFGTQQRSGRMFRVACELVRNGHVGKLKHINIWAPGSAPGGSRKVVAPPQGWDYDFWLGPAPAVPYTENRCSAEGDKKTWWFISDYTLGFVTGWGIHPMDIAVWGAETLFGETVEVEGRGTFRNAEGVCDTATIWEVDYRFGSGLTMKFIGLPNGVNQGKATGDPALYQDEWKARYRQIESHGTAFEGADGWVHVDRSRINLQPENLIDVNLDNASQQLVRSSNHAVNFLEGVRSRQDAVSTIDAAVLGDTLCDLGDAAMRLGRKLKFNLKSERFIGDETANARLRARPMRKPWSL